MAPSHSPLIGDSDNKDRYTDALPDHQPHLTPQRRRPHNEEQCSDENSNKASQGSQHRPSKKQKSSQHSSAKDKQQHAVAQVPSFTEPVALFMAGESFKWAPDGQPMWLQASDLIRGEINKYDLWMAYLNALPRDAQSLLKIKSNGQVWLSYKQWVKPGKKRRRFPGVFTERVNSYFKDNINELHNWSGTACSQQLAQELGLPTTFLNQIDKSDLEDDKAQDADNDLFNTTGGGAVTPAVPHKLSLLEPFMELCYKKINNKLSHLVSSARRKLKKEAGGGCGASIGPDGHSISPGDFDDLMVSIYGHCGLQTTQASTVVKYMQEHQGRLISDVFLD